MSDDNKITLLTDNDKQFLRSKTVASLPDNPSDKRWSASQIKLKMYEGYLVLYEWLKRLASESYTLFERFDLPNILAELDTKLTIEEQDYVIPLEDR